MKNPISVVIPLYNKEDYIRRALDSVLEQSYPAEEIIVVDDGSTDDSASIVKQEYPTVRLITQANAGVSAARNKGLSVASNGLVALLDADDQFCPDHLLHLNELYNRNPGFALYGNNFKQVSTEREVDKTIKYEVRNYIAEYPNQGGLVNSSSSLINKSLLDSDEVFPIGITMGEDVYTWVKLISLSKGMVPVSSYVGSIYYDDTDGAMNSGKSKPFPEVLKPYSPLWQHNKTLTSQFERHFFEDYVRSIYHCGTRWELVKALIQVRKRYVVKFALKLFVPAQVIGFAKSLRTT